MNGDDKDWTDDKESIIAEAAVDAVNPLAETTKGNLVANLMDLVEALENAQEQVVLLSNEARQYQAELADRGTHMQFDALDGILTIAHNITPAPGITESIPEEFDTVEQITIREPLDNRTATQIQRDAAPTKDEVVAESATLEEYSGREMQKAINSMMKINY